LPDGGALSGLFPGKFFRYGMKNLLSKDNLFMLLSDEKTKLLKSSAVCIDEKVLWN